MQEAKLILTLELEIEVLESWGGKFKFHDEYSSGWRIANSTSADR